MRFEAQGKDHFVGHANGAALSLDNVGATLAVRAKDNSSTQLSMKVAGGREVAPVASDELPTKINRLLGNDESKWQRNIATYGKVTYPSVLDGVDLVFHGEQGQLEYDFVVAPGKDAAKVAMDIEGGESLSLTKDGDLAIKTAKGTLIQQRPRVYQRDAQGKAHDVKASYRLNGDKQVAFNVEAYDHSRPLVIDPILGYSTFLGAGFDDNATGIATSATNAYVVGWTSNYAPFNSAQFQNTGGASAQLYHIPTAPVLPPAPQLVTEVPVSFGDDAWVAKLDNAGRVVYLTFFGGHNEDYGTGIAVDAGGRVYVTGHTRSTDIKTTPNAFQKLKGSSNFSNVDSFLFTLNADGSDVTYSTYADVATNTDTDLGSRCPDIAFNGNGCQFTYDDWATSIAVSGGTVYLGGVAERVGEQPFEVDGVTTFSVDAAATGVFVAAFTAPSDGVTAGSTTGKHFFGGSWDAFNTGVAVTGGIVYVGGNFCDASTLTDTPNGFQTNYRGQCDGLLAGLDSNLTTANWLTFIGGTGYDEVNGLATLPNGHLYVTGQFGAEDPQSGCEGTCTPTSAVNGTVNGSSDAYVAHFDATHALSWVRLIGASGREVGSAIAVDPLGHAYITGFTESSDFPTTPPAVRNESDDDAFITEVAADGQSLVLSTFYGTVDTADFGTGISLSPNGIHICGTTGIGERATGGALVDDPGSVFYPPINATQPNYGGGNNDAFIARIQNSPLTLTPPDSSVIPGTDIGFVASGGIGFGYKFQIITTGSGNPTIDPNTGAYTAGDELGSDVVRVTDAVGNTASANVAVVSNQGSELLLSPAVTSVSPKGTIAFKATGGTQPYNFTLITNASGGNLAGTTGVYHAGPRGTVTDRVKVTDATGQTKTAIITVTDAITITPPSASLAQNEKQTFTATGGKGAPFTWAADKGAITQNGEFTAPLENIVVTITATDSLGNVGTATVAVGGAIAITPVNPNTFPKGTIQFQAIGGAGGYKFAVITSPAAGGTIGADSGLFTAGTNGGVTETVDVKDTADRHATTTVTVGPSLTITPATANPAGNSQVQFSAAGGSGAGYAFSIETSQSGASIDGASGLYTAGPNGGQDVVKLVDSVGNEARATLNVTAAPSNGSNGGSNGGASSGTPGSNGGPGAGSSGTTNVGVGGNGNDDSGCAVGNVGEHSTSTSALAGLGLGLMLLARRRRTRKLDA